MAPLMERGAKSPHAACFLVCLPRRADAVRALPASRRRWVLSRKWRREDQQGTRPDDTRLVL